MKPKTMLRFVVASLLILSLCSGVMSQDSVCVPAEGTPLRIGAVFPAESLFGVDAAAPYRGVRAMVAAVNACGGVDGRPAELVYMPAANHDAALAAVSALQDDVALVVGSGSGIVSEVLANAAGEDTFFFWEVTEPLDAPHPYALSPRPNDRQLGAMAAAFVEREIATLLPESTPPRVALVYEDQPRAGTVADSVKDTLSESPRLVQQITRGRSDGYATAVRAREDGINVMILAAFSGDAGQAWYDMQQADANVAAWVQISGGDERQNTCRRMGNTDGLISLSAAGEVSESYRRGLPLYVNYQTAYHEQFQALPDERADVAASGMYLLLRMILPGVSDDFAPAEVQAAAIHVRSESGGLMSEGWSLNPETYVNDAAVAVIAQRQEGVFCTLLPDAIATCGQPLQSFPTWRDRAKMSSC